MPLDGSIILVGAVLGAALLILILTYGAARKEIRTLREKLGGETQKLSDEIGKNIRLEEKISGLEKNHAERLDEIVKLKGEIEDKFQSLASNALDKNAAKFLDLVSERFKAHKSSADEDLSKRQEAIDSLVKPLSEKLGKFDTRIGEIEKARSEAYGAIKSQVLSLAESNQSLSKETRKLVQALRAPKTRGRWGEMQLRQVFEMAGMSEHVDLILDKGIHTDDGLRRPDAIVKIPGGKSIVVDAKAPLDAYLDALDSDGVEAQDAALRRHAMQVKNHVKGLASKSYQDALPMTPDFVVMFIPGETFVSAAVEVDPNLIEYAFENKVLIATPTTLVALIKAIAYGWQQERMTENAVEIQEVAKEIYDRLKVFAGHLEKTGRSLGQSVENYNRAIGSLEGRILPAARKFEALGVVSAGTTIEGPGQVEHEPRKLTAAELTTIGSEAQ